MVDNGGNRVGWLEALEVLEAYVFERENADFPDADWVVPWSLGPIPADLIDRATRLLEAQRARVAALDETRQSVGRHLSAVRSVAPRADRSVYLDVTS